MNASDDIKLIDLIDFFKNGKWIISFFVAVFILLGIGYAYFSKARYEVSTTYSINIHSIGSHQLCNANTPCKNLSVANEFVALTDGGWGHSSRNNKLYINTKSPLNSDDYEKELALHNDTLTNSFAAEATGELNFINSEINSLMMNTETIANSVITAKRIIFSINNGEKAMNFRPVSIRAKSLDLSIVMLLAGFLGGMVGVFFLILRNVMRDHDKQTASNLK